MDRTVVLVTPPPGTEFPDLGHGFEYLRRGFRAAGDGPGLLRAWGDPDAPWVLRIDPAGSRWRLTSWGVGPAETRRAARSLFAWDDPLEEFYRAVRSEPVLRGSERRFRGLRIPRDGSLYESLVHAVIGQQLSVAVAATLERRLVEAGGAVVAAEGIEVPHVPGPRLLLDLGLTKLAKIGLSRAKQAALVGIARAALSGELAPVEAFRDAPREEAIERLDRLHGVGRWTAENALLRGAGRRDLFLAGDLGLRSALDAYGALPRERPEDEARAWGERWYPGWGSYATLYLWRKWVADGAPRTVTPGRRTPPSRGGGAPPHLARAGSRRRQARAPAARRRNAPHPR